MLIVIWKLLHKSKTYSDPGGQLTPERIRHRMSKCIKGLESLGFRVTIIQNPDIQALPDRLSRVRAERSQSVRLSERVAEAR
jgi:hypothetical protein